MKNESPGSFGTKSERIIFQCGVKIQTIKRDVKCVVVA